MGEEATVLTQAALAVHEAARMHKSSEWSHRKKARQLMRQFEQMKEQLAAMGIELEIEGSDPGGHSHGRHRHT